MAVPKRKNSKVRFKYSILKKELQRRVKKINVKSLNSLNKYRRKFY